MSLPWPVNGPNGITIPDIDSALGDGLLSQLTADPLLCERIKIEAIYADAIENQEEHAEQIRSEEALIIPDDIDYLE